MKSTVLVSIIRIPNIKTALCIKHYIIPFSVWQEMVISLCACGVVFVSGRIKLYNSAYMCKIVTLLILFILTEAVKYSIIMITES